MFAVALNRSKHHQSATMMVHPRCGRRGWRAVMMWGLCLLVALVSPAAYPAPLAVTVVVSDDSTPYKETASGIAAGLDRNGARRVRTIGLDAVARMQRTDADVIVTLGSKATQAVTALDLRIPVLSTLIPKAGYEALARKHKDKPDHRYFSAIYLDQPIARQLDLIRTALPDKQRVGAILGPESGRMLESLRTETQSRGLRLHAVRVGTESELFPALQGVLDDTDVLLSLPDSQVFNTRTIQSILITTYRLQVPVIGFSPNYVQAGALMAVHSTPAQLARQVAEVIGRLSAAAPWLPAPQYPAYFSVAVNYHVARSLGLAIEKEEKLAAKIEAPGGKP